MKSIRSWRFLVPSLLLTALLTSCGGDEVAGGPGTGEPKATSASPTPGFASSPVTEGGPVACVDWVRFETPQDQYDKAPVVLIGKSVSQAGESTIYGSKATTHLIEVERVLKGDPGDGNLRISSMPPTCTVGETYPDGDPLDTAERVIIFATEHGAEWFTMTPARGVMSFPQGSSLPFH
ncbi:hypothetical protein FBY33_1392 [Arthrobacter sp. SLBN-112]|nr:hypothetical protein FBY33_1392 [Arthrobacter sp. SLBN-112]